MKNVAHLGVGLLLVLLLLTNQHGGVRCQNTQKPVTALLHSKWARTPILLESSEFIASEASHAFWKFVEATKNIDSTVNTSKELYDAVLEQAEQLLSPMTYSLFIFSLSLHTHSPTIEMFNQVALERLSAVGQVDCPAFVDVAGKVACSVEELNLILENENAGEEYSSPVQLFKFDHRFPSSSSLSTSPNPPTAVLYAQLGTPEFTTLHNTLATVAKEGRVQYVFRHFVKDPPKEKVRLSGYGVELAVKSTEYKAVDDTQVQGEDESRVVEQTEGSDELEGFLFNTLKVRYPDLAGKMDEFRAHLLQGAREIPELKVWQLQELGFQAAQRIVSSGPDLALKTMKDIAQNFPMQAKSLSRSPVSKELRQEIVNRNQKMLSMIGVQPGDNILLLDGILLQEGHSDIFNMMEILLSESRLVEGLGGLGINRSDYQDILHLPVMSEFKTFAIDMRNESVVFINDLEKDRLYSSWPKSLHEFLRPSYPGMLKQVARNTFNLVFCLDPTTPIGIEILEYVKLFLDHMVPARLGVLLVVDEGEEGGELGVALTRGFSYLVERKSPREALKWLVQQTQIMDQLNVSAVVKGFEKKFGQTLLMGQSLDEIFGDESQYDSLRMKSLEFFRAKGFDSLPQVLVNGGQVDMEEDLETAVVTKIQQQSFEVAQALFSKRIKDSTNIYDYFLNKSNVLQRVNKHVVAKGSSFDLSAQVPSKGFSRLSELSLRDLAAVVASNLHYFSSEEGEFSTKPLSVWVVADLGTTHGREVARNAFAFATSVSDVRVALVHNPSTSPSSEEDASWLLARAVLGALESHRVGRRGWNLVRALLEEGEGGGGMATIEDVLRVAGSVERINVSKLEAAMRSPRVDDIIASHVTFCGRGLDLERGMSALLSNGRLVGPLLSNETLVVADFQMLHQFEMNTHATVVMERVGEVEMGGVTPDDDTADFRSDLVMKVASLLRSEPSRRRIKEPKLLGEHSGVLLPSSDPDLELRLVAYLNPLSPGTQQLAPLIQTLYTATSVNVEVYLNPVSKLSAVPIKSFYRFVIESELSFEEDGSISPGPLAVFLDLPHSPLLTLNMDVPHSWLVEVVWSPHDLDNIHLEEVERGVHGEFELEHILVEGQCFDSTTSSPTPGLEYVLGTASQPERFDTIVMANLGYFQLKAAPGAWVLKLREGRSSEIYSVVSYYGSEKLSSGEGGEEEEGIRISVSSFRGAGVVVMVAKRPGMEKEHLLYEKEEDAELEEEEEEEEEEDEEEEEGEGALWETISRWTTQLYSFFIGGAGDKTEGKNKKKQVSSVEKLEVSVNETINIFSIASGHLYERFLRIMMLGVLKHTHNPVKFWFLKNFLSPTFKDFIPLMAREYGFEYELVQYKWPRWLHAQTEKQRIIWGYKILFLDVLFPLEVKKIIFVDADQIVRADLRELLEIPLHGAPYAYTPFCDSRPDMAGFRFWERGYWKNFLGKRKYHISALYLVDLKRFRQLAAGDRLRGQYQALSQDPNSLANLDQDLPNNMVHSVPIYSLPQDWLWCETWCSDESKAHAKTIDLCNNPLTKEPKLVSAVRIAPEWTGYDQEVRLLQERVAQSQSTVPPSQGPTDPSGSSEHREPTHDHQEL